MDEKITILIDDVSELKSGLYDAEEFQDNIVDKSLELHITLNYVTIS